MRRSPSLHGGQAVSTTRDSSTKSISQICTRTVPKEIFIRNSNRRFAVLQGVRRREELLKERSPSTARASMPHIEKTSLSSRDRPHIQHEVLEEFATPPTIQDEEDVSSLSFKC